MPRHPFVEVVPIVGHQRDALKRKAAREIRSRDWLRGLDRDVALASVGILADFDDLSVRKFMWVHRVKNDMFILIQIERAPALAVIYTDSQHPVISGPLKVAFHKPPEPLSY